MMYFKTKLRKFIALLLLGSYVLGVLKPSIPIVNDVLAHSLDYFDHISTIHFENGEYHVHDELKKEEQKSTNSSTTLSDNKQLDIHIFSEIVYQFPCINVAEKRFIKKVGTPIKAMFQRHIPPPEKYICLG
jgi:hypothetical protein